MSGPAVTIKHPFLRVVNDPLRQVERLQHVLQAKGNFVLCLGSTRTSEIDGISFAGATPAERRLTPSIDADLLVYGRARPGETVPVSPNGIVSPVVVSRACLNLLETTPVIVDCGTFRAPMRSDLTAGNLVAGCVSTGKSLPYEHVVNLFEQGRLFAETLPDKDFLVLSECVPGGTTTALAVLKAFGIECDALVSSSLTSHNSSRSELVQTGLAKAGLESKGSSGLDPFRVLAAVGDPMQPFAAGLALAASSRVPVILGGGSQMLAVHYLCQRLSRTRDIVWNEKNLLVVTTKWITSDACSNTPRLSEMLSTPFFAAAPDFDVSRFAGLRAYEAGNVKEGVGAGALMLAASIAVPLTNAQLVAAIDLSYEELTGTSPS